MSSHRSSSNLAKLLPFPRAHPLSTSPPLTKPKQRRVASTTPGCWHVQSRSSSFSGRDGERDCLPESSSRPLPIISLTQFPSTEAAAAANEHESFSHHPSRCQDDTESKRAPLWYIPCAPCKTEIEWKIFVISWNSHKSTGKSHRNHIPSVPQWFSDVKMWRLSVQPWYKCVSTRLTVFGAECQCHPPTTTKDIEACAAAAAADTDRKDFLHASQIGVSEMGFLLCLLLSSLLLLLGPSLSLYVHGHVQEDVFITGDW